MLTLLVTSIILYSCKTTSQNIETVEKLYPNSIVYHIPNHSSIDFIVIDSCNQTKYIRLDINGNLLSTNIIKPCDK